MEEIGIMGKAFVFETAFGKRPAITESFTHELSDRVQMRLKNKNSLLVLSPNL